ncbi:MAG: sigma 54-interacting transcriptional regulator [Halobacteriovoraceae bacterium]|nr:sigma 54-interacting transcriptional regulator [Halobacteriovoraceae bacterium]
MKKVIYYSPTDKSLTTIPPYIKGQIVHTTSYNAIGLLYKAGATHVFYGENAEKEIKEFLKESCTEEFFNHYPTSDEAFYHSLKSTLQTFSSELPLLLLGESGVGKTHLAKAIHQFLTPNKPFLAKNLCELSSQLIESELFGHVKGAFTGAINDKEGLLNRADGGTLFLDEIGALPLDIQRKLLKVLEEGSFSPVGSTKEIKVSFNLITATCDNLSSLIKEKQFREDFYFRISGVSLSIPPLRERPDDIRFLLKEFQKGFSRQLFFSKEALETLVNLPWPGNTRELYYFYKKLQKGKVSYICELPIENIKPAKKGLKLPTSGLPTLIAQIEEQFFVEAVAKHGNRPNRVCKELNISKSVFYRLQEKLTSAREVPHQGLAN